MVPEGIDLLGELVDDLVPVFPLPDLIIEPARYPGIAHQEGDGATDENC